MMTKEEQEERIKLFWSYYLTQEYIEPYEDGRILEPLLQWSIPRIIQLKSVVILQDWHKPKRDKDGRIEPQGYDQWIQGCYDGAWDPTFRPLFRDSWSPEEIARGEMLVMNAVPGLRSVNCESSTSELPYKLHKAALTVYWLPFLKTVRPEHIYLCGAWAKPYVETIEDALVEREVEVELLCHPSAETLSCGKLKWTRKDHLERSV